MNSDGNPLEILELDWYYDFISPYAHLQCQRLERLPDTVRVNYHPVLFAGLLKHWGQLGPAEIPAKRSFMYQHILWMAERDGIDYNTPPAHPFNPLNALRLSIVAGNTPEAVDALFRAMWVDGHRPDDPEGLAAMIGALGIDDAADRIKDPEVKDALRQSTERAIERDVFGVPTFIARGKLFWGYDAFDFLLDFLENPGLLDSEEMRFAASPPVGVHRKR